MRTSVAHCHYDDASKRERLGNAVLEALSGQKTMKAAATAHGVNCFVILFSEGRDSKSREKI